MHTSSLTLLGFSLVVFLFAVPPAVASDSAYQFQQFQRSISPETCPQGNLASPEVNKINFSEVSCRIRKNSFDQADASKKKSQMAGKAFTSEEQNFYDALKKDSEDCVRISAKLATKALDTKKMCECLSANLSGKVQPTDFDEASRTLVAQKIQDDARTKCLLDN